LYTANQTRNKVGGQITLQVIAQFHRARYHHSTMMRLDHLLTASPIISIHGDSGVTISGLAYDSRQALPGFLFFALSGLHTDGHRYIEAALDNGAIAVVHEQPVEHPRPGTVYVRVANARAAMSPFADAFHGHPSRSIAVVGVTGTEGKSTTVWLIYRLLDLAGRKAGFISTVQYRTGATVEANPEHQTTPEATTIHEKIARMVANGFEFAIIESSSHGLSPRTNRLGNVAFDVGLMTNVRHEHLEFHGTWEQYRDDKANLFRALDPDVHSKTVAGKLVEVPSFGVACADDPSTPFFADVTERPVYTYSAASPRANLSASDIVCDDRGADFIVSNGDIELPARIELPGAFNVENVLGALAVVSRIADIPLERLVPLLPKLEPVPGRMTRIEQGQPFEVIVDYAHTPSSFEAILPSIKQRIRGSLICVFGSAGERDVQKRPAQGRIAAGSCDRVILTDEDPRGEDPMTLLEDIAAGCDGMMRDVDLFLIPDRALALRKAISLAQPGDALLLLGKGHETTIIYARQTLPWNEIEEARKALLEAGYTGSTSGSSRTAQQHSKEAL
jgi:UDP-N-acetylmuramoyl-L-alanyl-D-glutamate--2,6-diaminopimelate ligase